MNVRKRSGKVVPFDAEFIRRAVTLAAAAAGFCARAYILLRLWQLSRAMAPAPEASI